MAACLLITECNSMRATETKLSEFLTKQQVQYSIPIYQRTYSWKEEQCKQLWDDIVYAGSGENISATSSAR